VRDETDSAGMADPNPNFGKISPKTGNVAHRRRRCGVLATTAFPLHKQMRGV
jgi:hypothetical protein